jgi:hypothetical protein
MVALKVTLEKASLLVAQPIDPKLKIVEGNFNCKHLRTPAKIRNIRFALVFFFCSSSSIDDFIVLVECTYNERMHETQHRIKLVLVVSVRDALQRNHSSYKSRRHSKDMFRRKHFTRAIRLNYGRDEGICVLHPSR